MSLKKKLGMGIATAVLGIGLIGGGTYAFFTDTAEADSTFAAGTLNLELDPTTIINIDNLKPGDFMDRNFTLENNGTLDMSEILLSTEFTASEPDFGNHIMVKFMQNMDKNGNAYPDSVIYEKTLNELVSETPDLVDKLSSGNYEDSGLTAGDADDLIVRFEFIETGQDNQNHLQGADLQLEWTFTAKQTDGERR